MNPAFRLPLRAWGGLLLLLALEIGASFLHLGWIGPPLVMVIAAAMVAVVGFAFMHLRGASSLAQGFVVAALVWLTILIGLTAVDRFTRTDYPVPVSRSP